MILGLSSIALLNGLGEASASERLVANGYENTPAGISQFQRDFSLPVTGRLDAATLKELGVGLPEASDTFTSTKPITRLDEEVITGRVEEAPTPAHPLFIAAAVVAALGIVYFATR